MRVSTRLRTAPVLILYTGGTIGMEPGPDGWQAASRFDAQIRARLICDDHDDTWRRSAMPAWRYIAMDPPIDSANMTQQHWLRMRDIIVQAVEQDACSAVLILHGTDTLAYTAAALSFLLLELPVPVCITGAMHPARVENTDAWENLFGALQWLPDAAAGTVHVFFDGKAYPATRVTKGFNDRRDAFVALRPIRTDTNLPDPLLGLAYPVMRKPVHLGILPLYPGVDVTVLQALLDTGVRGLVLELYGSGTSPVDDAHFLEALSQARRRGIVLVGISQCPGGVVDPEQYATASRMLQSGVLPSGPMTREAALGKLFGLLGAGLVVEQVVRWWPVNICGEWGERVRLE